MNKNVYCTTDCTMDTTIAIYNYLESLGGIRNCFSYSVPDFVSGVNLYICDELFSDDYGKILYTKSIPENYIFYDIKAMNSKISLQSDGTIETGKKIIDYLISLGGININKLNGRRTGSGSRREVYYINSLNIITYSYDIPEGYTLMDVNHIFDINIPTNTSEEDKIIIENLLNNVANKCKLIKK